MGVFKLNFDGSVNVSTKDARFGGIIQDCQGKMIDSYAGQLEIENPLKDNEIIIN